MEKFNLEFKDFEYIKKHFINTEEDTSVLTKKKLKERVLGRIKKCESNISGIKETAKDDIESYQWDIDKCNDLLKKIEDNGENKKAISQWKNRTRNGWYFFHERIICSLLYGFHSLYYSIKYKKRGFNNIPVRCDYWLE